MGGYFEDPITGVIEIFSKPWLLFWCCAAVCSILFFNLNSLTLTKHVSCVFSQFWNATRTISVWVLSS